MGYMKTRNFDILLAIDGEDYINVGRVVTPDEWVSVHDWLGAQYANYVAGLGDEAILDFFNYLRSVGCEVYFD